MTAPTATSRAEVEEIQGEIRTTTSRLRERVAERGTAPNARIKVLTGRDGDREISWDKGKSEDVSDARSTFDNYVKRLGYKAFAVDPATGGQGQQIKEFDPTLEKILLTPALQGG